MTNSEQQQFEIPDPAQLELEISSQEYLPNISSSEPENILRRHEADLLAIPGVTMVSHQMVEPGKEAIVVGVIDAGVLARLPSELDGLPVRGEVTGPIEAR